MPSCPLVVGMPCHRRAWALDAWFDSLEAQDPPDGTRLLFALSEEGDPSERVIYRRWPEAEVIYAPGPALDPDDRYDDRRVPLLASIRNRLLRAVQGLGARRYLSWDSDVVLEPGALGELGYCDGVSGALIDMGGQASPGAWSWMELSGRDAFRPRRAESPEDPFPRETAPFRVGVVMGVKLMDEHAYRSVRYADHPLGEDVAFALCAEAVGVPRWLVPAARGRHAYRLSGADAP